MIDLVTQIHNNHVNKQFYHLKKDGNIIETSELKEKSVLSTPERLLTLSEQKNLNEKEKRVLKSCAYDYIRWIEKKGTVKPENRTAFNKLYAKAFLGLFKDDIQNYTIESLKKHIESNSPWLQFICSNTIHYATHSQQLNYHQEIVDKVCVNGSWYNFSQLLIIKNDDGYQFYNNAELLFETDSSYKLKGYYYLGNMGVQKGELTEVKEINKFFNREPTGKHWLTVYVSQKDELQIQFGKSHAYLSLEDADGGLFYAGQMGKKDAFSLKEYLSPFGKMKMGIEAPDRYSSLPLAQHHLKELKIEITESEYNRLVESIRNDHQNGTPGSLIQGNCSEYVRKKLNLIGIKAKVNMTFQNFVMRFALQVLPKSIGNKIVQYTKDMPPLIHKVAHFNPILYPIVIIASAIVTLFSGHDWSDLSLIEAIFRPWKVGVSHPIALSEWMDQFEKEQNKYSILNTKAITDSKIGKIADSITEKLGYKVGEQQRFYNDKKVHITQHQPSSFILLILKTIFDAIKHHIQSWISSYDQIDKNSKLLYLHSLHNQKFISPYQYYNLRESIDNEADFSRNLLLMLDSLLGQKFIDRRSYIHLKKNLDEGKVNDTLQYIVAVSLLNSANNAEHYNAIHELITPKVQMEITTYLKNYEKNYYFSLDAVNSIQGFIQSIHCYEWAKKIEDTGSRDEICDAIKKRDDKKFSQSVRFYFTKIKNIKGIGSVQRQVYEEMIQSLEFPKWGTAFTSFAHSLQTQSSMLEVHRLIQGLKDQILQQREDISDEDIKTLRQLHQNIGIYLDANIEFSGSATFASTSIGNIRKIWEEIDGILSCSIIPKGRSNNVWPDIGFQEIVETSVVNDSKETNNTSNLKRKKIFFGHCSWGGGHKSVTNALAKTLGSSKYFIAKDIPDEVLINEDPLFSKLGPGYSITTLYNTCLSKNYWGLLDFMKQLGASGDIEEKLKIKKNIIRLALLQEQPDIVVATYEKDSHILLEVAQELGIPFVQVYTDMISRISEPLKDAFNSNRGYVHQKILSPYPVKEMKECIREAEIDSSKCSYMGYPIRKEFLQEHNIDTLKEKYNIKEDQKVILCMSGNAGCDLPWPTLIANAKEGSLSNTKVIVICGNNKAFYEKVKALRSIDPTIEIIAKGFTEAQEMAEICAIADLTITKPGGSTLAENIYMNNYLMLDTRYSDSLIWEKEAAEALSQYNMATVMNSTDGFIKSLKKALKKKVPYVPELHQFDGIVGDTFINEIDGMIEAAENDSGIMKRRSKMKSLDLLYPTMDVHEASRQNFERNLAELIHLNERINPENVIDSLKSSLWEAREKGWFLAFNHNDSQFYVSSDFKLKDLEYGLDVIIRSLNNVPDSIESDDLRRIANLVKNAQNLKLAEGKISHLVKRLEKVDFYYVSKRLQKKDASNLQLKDIKKYFSSDDAYKVLLSLAELQTSRSRRNEAKYGDERVLRENDLVKAFIHNPQQIEFIKKLHLHRQISTFDHKIGLDENHNLTILFKGKERPVSDLMNHFRVVNGKVINTDNEKEYIYTYNRGLSQVRSGQHPVEWKDEIPIFKVKNRKSKDYRVEIMSTTGGKENHGWLRLKDPEGNVYSVGAFWDPDYQLENIQRFNTMPGYVRGGGDLQEFLGDEKFWKRTKIVLDEEKFNQLKSRVIKEQQDGIKYNLVNSNCTSFVSRMLANLGIKYKLADSPLVAFLMPHTMKKFLMKNDEYRNVFEIITYPLRLIQNLALSLLGMYNTRDIDHLEGDAGFSKPHDIFTWEKGVVDTPSQLRLLQEILEEEYGQEGTDKIDFKQFIGTNKTNHISKIISQKAS